MKRVTVATVGLALLFSFVFPARAAAGPGSPAPASADTPRARVSCFLLTEVGAGEIRRSPNVGCDVRVTPASTFKIPHALAALDAGAIEDAAARFAYDGTPVPFASWGRDHTLSTAMRDSVVWYFQRIAEKLGPAREQEYLARLDYGNRDSSSGLTSFWLGGSLRISAEEQQRFLVRLYQDALAVGPAARNTVRAVLVQPAGVVVNAAGAHPFAAPWPSGTVVSAKTGSATERAGTHVKWLVGHVRRGSRAWVFVCCVAGPDAAQPLAAVDLAARSLREAHVL